MVRYQLLTTRFNLYVGCKDAKENFKIDSTSPTEHMHLLSGPQANILPMSMSSVGNERTVSTKSAAQEASNLIPAAAYKKSYFAGFFFHLRSLPNEVSSHETFLCKPKNHSTSFKTITCIRPWWAKFRGDVLVRLVPSMLSGDSGILDSNGRGPVPKGNHGDTRSLSPLLRYSLKIKLSSTCT